MQQGLAPTRCVATHCTHVHAQPLRPACCKPCIATAVGCHAVCTHRTRTQHCACSLHRLINRSAHAHQPAARRSLLPARAAAGGTTGGPPSVAFNSNGRPVSGNEDCLAATAAATHTAVANAPCITPPPHTHTQKARGGRLKEVRLRPTSASSVCTTPACGRCEAGAGGMQCSGPPAGRRVGALRHKRPTARLLVCATCLHADTRTRTNTCAGRDQGGGEWAQHPSGAGQGG
jgi:hypothetical protein